MALETGLFSTVEGSWREHGMTALYGRLWGSIWTNGKSHSDFPGNVCLPCQQRIYRLEKADQNSGAARHWGRSRLRSLLCKHATCHHG
jgi:hypothetical protein